MTDPVEALARTVAVEAHAGQVDKAGEPSCPPLDGMPPEARVAFASLFRPRNRAAVNRGDVDWQLRAICAPIIAAKLRQASLHCDSSGDLLVLAREIEQSAARL